MSSGILHADAGVPALEGIENSVMDSDLMAKEEQGHLKYLQLESHVKEGYSAMAHSFATIQKFLIDQESFRKARRPYESQYLSP